MLYSDDKFKSYLDNLPTNVVLYEHQKDAIRHVLKAIDGGATDIVLLGPTGCGKSHIAMFTSLYLNQQNLTGYILASEILLFNQYEDDFRKYKLNFGKIKGMDNYKCLLSNTVMSQSYCKSLKIKGGDLKNLPCYNSCTYYKFRDIASNAKTSLLTYPYWFIQRNNIDINNEMFKKRDFLIADEAHKLDMLLYEHFSPKLLEIDLGKIEELNHYFSALDIKVVNENKLMYFYNELKNSNNTTYDIDLLRQFLKYLSNLNGVYELERYLSSNSDSIKDDKSVKGCIRILNWVDDTMYKFYDFINNIIEEDNYVKSVSGKEIKFDSLNSELYFNKFFRSKSGVKIYMSATMGSFESIKKQYYMDNDKTVFIKIPQVFDYEKSRIFCLKNTPKIHYNSSNEDIEKCIKAVDIIINKHKNQKGIIHVTSYQHANMLQERFPDRLITYNDTKDKDYKIDYFIDSKDKILVGCSIKEGFNFENDKSRFQIYFKTPYLSLGSEFIKKKMKKSYDWYIWKTSINILQGVGRSIRHKDDYATTYLIDGSFKTFIGANKSYFPDDFLNRLFYI